MIPRVSISLAKCSAGRFRPIASVDASVAPARIDLVDAPDHRVEIGLARAAGDLALEHITLLDRDALGRVVERRPTHGGPDMDKPGKACRSADAVKSLDIRG